MTKLNRNKPITKIKYSKIFINISIGIWFVIPILLLRPLKKIYLAPLQTSRIGHFILDTEILLARIHLDQVHTRKKIFVIWVPEYFICNKYVYNIWKQKIHIVPYSLITTAILFTATYVEKVLKIRTTYRFIGWDGYLPYVHLLNVTPTVFSMPKEDEELCLRTLKINGIDISKKWVCILARDSKYLNSVAPDLDWDFNSYRNSNIDTFKIAAEYLAEKDIITFRMGVITEKPFSSDKSDLVIDYANSIWRDEKLDIYLAIKCLFFISTGTGLDSISVATRRPLLWVNQAQPLHVYRSKNDFMFITKYLYLRDENIFLSPSNFYELGVNEGFTVDNPLHLRAQDFSRLGVEIIDNTDAEIKEATVEMHDFLTKQDIEKLQLNVEQIKFWKTFPEDERLDNSGPPKSRVCKSFLRQNPWLAQ
jgi:hypothetical protein